MPAPAAASSSYDHLHWREALAPLLADRSYQPLDERGLVRRLNVPPGETAAFGEFLKAEEALGHVQRDGRGGYQSVKRLGLCAGHLQMNERGFGFLVPVDPTEPDFYISGDDTANALHGDLVMARLIVRRGAREGRLRGEVVRVLKRKRRQLVGTLRRSGELYYVQPDEPRIPYDVRVPMPRHGVVGEKVVVALEDWNERRHPLLGHVTEVLGAPDAPGVDLLSIIRKHDLPASFPEAVEFQAAEIPAWIAPEELRRREDFRPLPVLTIDPDDAKDFDDALSYRLLPGGDFEIHIHIADVSHYVQVGSALDAEACERGNSVYLVDRVIPMLPEKLSNGICSLQPHVDRLVKTAVVTLNADGDILHSRFAEGVIHSARRFTYQEAFERLRQPPTNSTDHDLHALHAMAQKLRRRRFARGALELDFPEVKVRVNELGIPTGLEKTENDISHQLIEEFMLLANETVALELKRRGRPALYRVHEVPDPTRLQEFRAQARSMGFTCGDLTQKGEIQKLLSQVRGKPGEEAVKIGLLKSLKRAMYSPKPLGHFGLSKINYTHFTSPIRRYSDLVVHRVLFNSTAHTDYDRLARLAIHLSNTERIAADAEQESVKLKKLEYFARQAKAQERVSFHGFILDVRANGLMVQLPEFLIQGMVPLGGAGWTFNAQRLELTEPRTRTVYRAGQPVEVEIAAVDFTRNHVDFRLAAAKGRPRPTPIPI
jgi:ribonuclease R